MSLIKLDRVEFREGMNRPGPPGQDGHVVYPGRDKVLVSVGSPNKRLTQGQHYHLWLDETRGVVIVAHPDSGAEPEKVPMANVLQYRETPAEKSAAKK